MKKIILTLLVLFITTGYCSAKQYNCPIDNLSIWYPDSFLLKKQKFNKQGDFEMVAKSRQSYADTSHISLKISACPQSQPITEELLLSKLNMGIEYLQSESKFTVYDYGLININGLGHEALYYIYSQRIFSVEIMCYVIHIFKNDKSYMYSYTDDNNIYRPEILNNMIKFSGFYQ